MQSEFGVVTAKRIEWLDILKGIAIILIVIGHLSLDSINPAIKNFIYSFHVPLFLFASGMVYKKRNSVKDFCRHDLLRVLYAYLFFTTLWILFEYLWKSFVLNKSPINHNIWDYLLTIISGNGNITGISIGAMWYLSMYFAIRLMYEAISFVSNKYIKAVVVGLAFISGGFFLKGNALPWCISSALTGLVFFYLGDAFKTYIFKFSETYKVLKDYRVIFPLMCYGIIILVGGTDSMSRNSYDSVLLFLLKATCGFWGTVALSIEFERIAVLRKSLTYYGVNSLHIMGWHSELRIVFIYLLGSVVHSGLVKNVLTLVLSLIVCIPLNHFSDMMLNIVVQKISLIKTAQTNNF